jgi:hypothetical protein
MDLILTHEELSEKPVIKPYKGIQIVDHRLSVGQAVDKGQLTIGATPRRSAHVAKESTRVEP